VLVSVALATLAGLGAFFGLGLLGARWAMRRILRQVLESAHEAGRCPVCERPMEHKGEVPPV
jgi:hypothetical protein